MREQSSSHAKWNFVRSASSSNKNANFSGFVVLGSTLYVCRNRIEVICGTWLTKRNIRRHKSSTGSIYSGACSNGCRFCRVQRILAVCGRVQPMGK
eukprot:1881308-Amphidinium_carterae.4